MSNHPTSTASAHPVLRDLRSEIQRLNTALEASRAATEHWQKRATARGHALKRANEINTTLTRVINRRLDTHEQGDTK